MCGRVVGIPIPPIPTTGRLASLRVGSWLPCWPARRQDLLAFRETLRVVPVPPTALTHRRRRKQTTTAMSSADADADEDAGAARNDAWADVPMVNMDGIVGSGLPRGAYVARYAGGDDFRAMEPLCSAIIPTW